MVPDRDDPEVETPFIISFPLKYTARSPFGRATRPMLAFNTERRNIAFPKDYWRADVDGMEKEGEIYALLESIGVPNIAAFGKGNDVSNHMSTQRREVAMLVKGYGAPQAIQNVSERRRSAFDLTQLLTEFVSAVANAMAGKTSFADSDSRNNFSLLQHINMHISTLMSFIATSVQVIS
jgi:hypothetical protein